MNIVHVLLSLAVVLFGVDVAADVPGDVLVWLSVVLAAGAGVLDVTGRNKVRG